MAREMSQLCARVALALFFQSRASVARDEALTDGARHIRSEERRPAEDFEANGARHKHAGAAYEAHGGRWSARQAHAAG